ncbi:alcohol dehydrogenase catalytic domain-containing protein [Leptothoe spongobia]|uniref:Alcohol dehydrogenase-like N-terminal domain-containing protein n=1 Tax=Leptothoe spongobia TAU-MAC 1115 TaxID=1967444 RepID=A0A947DMT3_9CYAN|nr:hypothetical protein [Leptothoe spongobia]MBT9317841.1 hypothetical protein [Leptothoe spongobia TAU-MAC 1115]
MATSQIHKATRTCCPCADTILLTREWIVQDNYGSTDVLRLEDVDKPVLQDNQVLVKVYASSVNAGDWHLMRGTPFLIRVMLGGIARPKIKTLGMDVAEHVVNVGNRSFSLNEVPAAIRHAEQQQVQGKSSLLSETKSWLMASGIAGHPQGSAPTRLSIFNQA